MFVRKNSHCKRGHEYASVGIIYGGCHACRRTAAIAWNLSHPRAKQNSNFKNLALLTLAGLPFTSLEYDRLYQVQQGRCKICGIHQSSLSTKLHTDHDHITNIVRGLLCFNCNKQLGVVEKFSSKAHVYLKEAYNAIETR